MICSALACGIRGGLELAAELELELEPGSGSEREMSEYFSLPAVLTLYPLTAEVSLLLSNEDLEDSLSTKVHMSTRELNVFLRTSGAGGTRGAAGLLGKNMVATK